MAAREDCTRNAKGDVSGNENEDSQTSVFLSLSQINILLEQDVDGVQRKFEEFLNLKELETNLKEAILVDYYVSGFWWAKEVHFSSQQLIGFMELLHVLMENIATTQMSLEENLKEMGRALTGIGQCLPDKKGSLSFFNVDQARDIISYFKMSLFQHYKLYEYMFNSSRDEMVIGAKQVIEVVKSAETPFPAPLEEGISSDIYSQFIAPLPKPSQDTENIEETDLSSGELKNSEKLPDKIDPLVDLTVEDVKKVLNEVTTEVIGSLQAELNEKLRLQEEAFTEKIEKLKKL